MKIFKGKAFFFTSMLIYIFLTIIISFVTFIFFENKISDVIRNHTSAKKLASDDIVLVMIDDESTKDYRWPWARSLYAEMIEYLDEYTNSKAIVFDVILNAYDKNNPPSSDEYFFNTVKKSDKFIAGFMTLFNEYADKNFGIKYDEKFKNKYFLKVNSDAINKKQSIFDKLAPQVADFFSSEGLYNSLSTYPDKYFNSLKYNGNVNFLLDPRDSTLRYSNDLIYYKDNYYPSLTLKTFMLVNKSSEITLTDKFIYVKNSDLKIPVSESYKNFGHKIKYYRIPQNSKYSHKSYHAIDIINSNRMIKEGKKPVISPSEFNNKIIVIGANAMNVRDTLNTLVAEEHPGLSLIIFYITTFYTLSHLHKIHSLLYC